MRGFRWALPRGRKAGVIISTHQLVNWDFGGRVMTRGSTAGEVIRDQVLGIPILCSGLYSTMRQRQAGFWQGMKGQCRAPARGMTSLGENPPGRKSGWLFLGDYSRVKRGRKGGSEKKQSRVDKTNCRPVRNAIAWPASVRTPISPTTTQSTLPSRLAQCWAKQRQQKPSEINDINSFVASDNPIPSSFFTTSQDCWRGGAWEWAEGRPERSHCAKSNASISSAKSYNTFNWDKAFYSLSGN